MLVASCTSTFSFEDCFRHVLVANAQAGSHGPVHALHQGVSISLELHPRNSHDSVCPKPSQKRSESGWCMTTPVDDTDVDQCSGCIAPLSSMSASQ